MSEAFVDTTVLTNALLKDGEIAAKAKAALEKFDRTLLPVYAIKEFKAGPLSHFVWLHNEFAETRSMNRTYKAVHARRGKMYTVLTALEALAATVAKDSLKKLVEKYGDNAKPDRFMADQHRYHLAYKIRKAWSRRRKLTSEVVDPLPCYAEVDLREDGQLLDAKPTSCTSPCCLSERLVGRLADVEVLREALKKSGAKRPEDTRRATVLRTIAVRPATPMDQKACRSFGDAYFALFCPAKATILTTNVKDHEVLAGALGKSVVAPDPA